MAQLMNLLILALILGYCFVKAQNATPCGGNWQPYLDGKCFRIVNKLVNFPEAESICTLEDSQAHLVSIGSSDEQAFLSRYLFTLNKVVDNVWLGARAQGDGQFKWEDGSNLNFSNWLTGSPAKPRDNYCVQMNSEDGLAGKWSNVSCSKKNLVVCQKAQILSPDKMRQILKQINEKLAKIEAESRKESSLPLGFIYVQLPKESPPSDLWPSMKWTDVSATYEGVFFRVAGGEAAEFGEIQQENSPRLAEVETAGCQVSPTYKCGALRESAVSGSVPDDGRWSQYVWTAINYVFTIEDMEDGRLNRYRDFIRFRNAPGEVRPRNMAVKVWKRTG